MGKRTLILTLLAVGILAAVAYGLRATGVWGPAVAVQQTGVPAGPGGGGAGGTGAGGPGGGAGGGGKRPPAPVEIATSTIVELADSIPAIGSLVARDSAEVTADTNGRIVSISAVEGAAVKAGDELFRLDGTLLAAEVNDAMARLALAEASFRRNQTLARSQTVAQAVVEQARAELELARSAVDLVKERQNRLVVRAPFDGHLGFRLVSTGAYVTAGTPLVRIDHIATLKVGLSIPERFYGAISAGQSVDIAADAVPGKIFRARIMTINPVVDVNGRALQVLAELDNSALDLRPGMLVRADVLGERRKAVMVPESTVVPQGKQNVVFSVKDGKVARLVVTTGLRRNGLVEITSGLDGDVTVVTAGNLRLADGAAVKPLPARPAVAKPKP